MAKGSPSQVSGEPGEEAEELAVMWAGSYAGCTIDLGSVS